MCDADDRSDICLHSNFKIWIKGDALNEIFSKIYSLSHSIAWSLRYASVIRQFNTSISAIITTILSISDSCYQFLKKNDESCMTIVMLRDLCVRGIKLKIKDYTAKRIKYIKCQTKPFFIWWKVTNLHKNNIQNNFLSKVTYIKTSIYWKFPLIYYKLQDIC